MNGFSIINAGGGGGTITNIFGTPGQINVATAGTDATVSLIATGVSAGSYTNANITVDGLGRITTATSGPSTNVADWANYPAVATIQGGNQVMNGVRQVALSNPISQKALTLNFDNITYAPGSGNPSMIDVNIGAETGEVLTTCPSSKPTLSYNSGTETLSLLGPTPSGTTVLSSVALPGSGVETLAQVLARGNNAGANSISMNTTNKITDCANPTSAQDVATKAYVDARPAETLATTLIAGNNCGANSIDLNGNSLLGANNITMPSIAPVITATSAIGVLSITALGGTNMATTGICNITSVGRLNLGSATYTNLENLRIDNSAITKESGADISIDNLAYIRNNQTLITLTPDSVNPSIFIDSAGGGQVQIQNNSVPTMTFTNTSINAVKPLSFSGSLTGALNASQNNITNVNSLGISNNGTQTGTLTYDNTNNAIQTSVKLRTPTLVDKNQVTGTANQVLTSDGAGAIEWATVGSGGSQTLAQVLANGNSAGAYQIGMNNQGIGGIGFLELIDTTNPLGSVSVLQYRVLGNRVFIQSGLNIGATDTSTGVFLTTPNFALRDYNGGGQVVAMLFDQASGTIKVGTAGGASGINAKLSLPNNLIMNGYTIQQTRFADLTNSTGTAGQVITANGSGDWAWVTPTVSPASVNTPIAFGSNISPFLSQSLAFTTSFQQYLLNGGTTGTVNFTMPTLNAGANSLVVQVSCPNGAWTPGPGLPVGATFACYMDLFDVTTNTTINGNYTGASNGYTVVPFTSVVDGGTTQGFFSFQLTDTFFPAPTAGNNIQVRVWIKLFSPLPSPQPFFVLSSCSVTVTQTVTQ
jgi:hypothetical protein